MNNLHAKALRGYAWLLTTPPEFDASRDDETGLWEIMKIVEKGWNEQWETYSSNVSDSMFLAFCEDRGWIEAAEDEGVEWNEWVTVQDGNFTVSVNNRTDGSGYDWDIWCNRSSNMIDSGSKPTRAEARKAAIEAARELQ